LAEESHSQQCLNLSFDEIATLDISQCFAILELSNSANDGSLKASTYLVAPKNMRLQDTQLVISQERHGDEVEITLSTGTYYPRIWLTSNVIGKFSDNYFSLLPGEERTVHFTSQSTELVEILVKSFNEILSE
jgi:hypothetical protein